MATCVRGGNLYKRHKFTVLHGVKGNRWKVSVDTCTACGKQNVKVTTQEKVSQ